MSEVRIPCSWCGQPFFLEHLVDQDDGTLLCVGCIARRAAAAQFEKDHPNLASLPSTGFASDGVQQVWTGETVIYHGQEADVEATVIRFTGIGANLDVDGLTFRDVRRGPNPGQWEPLAVAAEE